MSQLKQAVKENKNHYVYKIVDPVTDEFYIGVRSCSGSYENDKYMGSYCSWKPENKDRLEKEILCLLPSREIANELEVNLIENFIDDELNRNDCVPSIGFYSSGKNFIPLSGVNHPLTKPILQYNLKGEFIKEWDSPVVYKNKTGKCKDTIMACALGYNKISHGYIWKYKQDVNNKNDIDIYKHFSDSYYKYVKQYDAYTGEFVNEYYSITYAAKKLGLSSINISRCLNNKQKTSGGYIWINKFDENGNENYLTDIKKSRCRKRKVLMADKKSGEILQEYNSITEAAKDQNVHIASISLCCNNKRKSCNGYIWTFKYDKDNNLIKKINPDDYKDNLRTKVECIDPKTNEVIKTFNSMREAERNMNVTSSSVSLVCSGKLNSSGGYKWRKCESN